MKQGIIIDTVIDILYRIVYEEAYSSIIPIKIKEKDFSKAAESYALRLAYGVLENLLLLNHYLDQLAKKRIKKKVRLLILLALYEIEFMDNNADHISVNAYVNYAKQTYPYAKNFVNAILRNHLRLGVNRFKPQSFAEYALYYSHPIELANLFKKAYGEKQAIAIMQANQSRAKLNLRCNLSKLSSAELIVKLKDEGVEASLSDKSKRCVIVDFLHANSINKLNAYQDGLFYVQDIASILLVDALKIKGNENILDLCAAPGGKALALAEDIKRQNGVGKITACDIFTKKLAIIKESADRLGLSINIVKNDASIIKQEFSNKFDIVLADVPCSGFGIIRKKTEIKYRKLGQNLENMVKLQEEILELAANYVKIGGKLVYSTCTMNPAENQKQVDKFLQKNNSFVFDRFETLQYKAESYIQLLTSDTTDGFFIAILKRVT